jgi:hypothetical protein
MRIMPERNRQAKSAQTHSTRSAIGQEASDRYDNYERLLAVMQAATRRSSKKRIDWDAEWGDQSEED